MKRGSKEETHMQYTKRFKLMASVSIAIIAIGIIVGFVFGGMNLGVDFTGGTLVTIDLKRVDFDMDVITGALDLHGVTGAQAVRTGNTTSSQTMADIRMQTIDDDAAESEQRAKIIGTVRETYPEAEIINVDRVGAVASQDLVRNAMLSVLIASALILVYVWVRFELLSGCAAIMALLHDVCVMLALTCILRIPVNSSFIAAVLTIVGYSINNTIIIFDRIRETSKHSANVEKHLDEIINTSIRATLTRSINTTITTLLPITMIYILGVESIRQFSLPIIVGLLAGAYSSIFVAGPLWGKWHTLRYTKAKAGAAAPAKGSNKKNKKSK